MGKETYHHGDLKQELIEKGLLLINKDGLEGFSLRRVASMCNVSHNAPYKHFKDKDALITEITKTVSRKFYNVLLEVTERYPFDAIIQITEMGKTYVKFMVENPEYMKFMFLNDITSPIKIRNNQFYDYDKTPFEVFMKSSKKYFTKIGLAKEMHLYNTLTMWSMVHGVSMLILEKGIEYEGDYLDLAEKMIKTNILNIPI